MNEPSITCPQCKSEIKLTESLAAPLVKQTEERYRRMLEEQQKKVDGERDKLRAEAEALQNEQESGYQVLLNEAIANLENRIKLLKVKVQSRKGEARKTMDTAIVDLEARRLALLPQTAPLTWDELMHQGAYQRALERLP